MKRAFLILLVTVGSLQVCKAQNFQYDYLRLELSKSNISTYRISWRAEENASDHNNVERTKGSIATARSNGENDLSMNALVDWPLWLDNEYINEHRILKLGLFPFMIAAVVSASANWKFQFGPMYFGPDTDLFLLHSKPYAITRTSFGLKKQFGNFKPFVEAGYQLIMGDNSRRDWFYGAGIGYIVRDIKGN